MNKKKKKIEKKWNKIKKGNIQPVIGTASKTC